MHQGKMILNEPADVWNCAQCGARYDAPTAEVLGHMCENGPCRARLAPLFDANGNQHSRFTNQPGMLPKEY